MNYLILKDERKLENLKEEEGMIQINPLTRRHKN